MSNLNSNKSPQKFEGSTFQKRLESKDRDILFPIERRRLFVQSVMADTRHNLTVTDDGEGDDVDIDKKDD